MRGFRIELGEIEAALARHPAVAEAVVAGARGRRAPAGGLPRAAPRGGARRRTEVWAHLCRPAAGLHGPGGARPSRPLPLSANGKVDRKALAKLAEPPLRAASGEGEVRAHRWRSSWPACGQGRGSRGRGRRIGVHDYFFSLGGHSITGASSSIACRKRSTRLCRGRPVRAPHGGRPGRLPGARVSGSRGASRGHGGGNPRGGVRRTGADREVWTEIESTSREGEPLPSPSRRSGSGSSTSSTPARAAYNVPAALFLAGRLDATRWP